jgi:hypothetical protein
MKSLPRLFAAGAMLVVSACQDSATAPDGDDFAAARSATKVSNDVRIAAVQYGTDGTVTYSVRVRSNSRTVSSFQGILWLPVGGFELRSQSPVPISGGAALINVADINSGRIRFSAFTQTYFNTSGEGVEVFRFVIRPLRAGDPPPTGILDFVGMASNSAPGAGAIAASLIASDAGCSGTELWGDGNDDGLVNINDAQQIARYGIGLTVGNPAAVANRGDVTADGLVNVGDAQQIARYGIGLSAVPRTGTSIC